MPPESSRVTGEQLRNDGSYSESSQKYYDDPQEGTAHYVYTGEDRIYLIKTILETIQVEEPYRPPDDPFETFPHTPDETKAAKGLGVQTEGPVDLTSTQNKEMGPGPSTTLSREPSTTFSLGPSTKFFRGPSTTLSLGTSTTQDEHGLPTQRRRREQRAALSTNGAVSSPPIYAAIDTGGTLARSTTRSPKQQPQTRFAQPPKAVHPPPTSNIRFRLGERAKPRTAKSRPQPDRPSAHDALQPASHDNASRSRPSFLDLDQRRVFEFASAQRISAENSHLKILVDSENTRSVQSS
ncbi:hypothetical protein M5D96_014215 [Drosophila gunungcola]|uniref:Uncharacterized protein n=1 Tax=Drosophila gunungcola TaxID=103775 RepID=A0A9P9Y9U0_9MUSC|nr:hypothetical protein M5D96_014215 [Drosophila gunungcola]